MQPFDVCCHDINLLTVLYLYGTGCDTPPMLDGIHNTVFVLCVLLLNSIRANYHYHSVCSMTIEVSIRAGRDS